MELARYHSPEGYYMVLIERVGTKWIRVLYVGETRLKAVKKSEKRFMVSHGEVTPKQLKIFRAAAKRRNDGTLAGLSKAVRGALTCANKSSSTASEPPTAP